MSQVEFVRFLEIAFGSACEVESIMLLSQRLGYCKQEQSASLMTNLIELKRSLNSFIQKIKRDSTTG
jgi:four helix bundle protein